MYILCQNRRDNEYVKIYQQVPRKTVKTENHKNKLLELTIITIVPDK